MLRTFLSSATTGDGALINSGPYDGLDKAEAIAHTIDEQPAAKMLATEAELERLEAAMSDGGAGEETLSAYAAAQQRLEHGGGYRWRDGVLAVLRGLGFDGRRGLGRGRGLDLQ